LTFILTNRIRNVAQSSLRNRTENKTLERIIVYYSRVLIKTEKNYYVTRRELLAIVDSLKSFHHYLYGWKFLIRTDHISLKWFMSFKDLEGQLMRWLERNVDGLYKRPCFENNCSYCAKTEHKDISSQENILWGTVLREKSRRMTKKTEDPNISLILRRKESRVWPIR